VYGRTAKAQGDEILNRLTDMLTFPPAQAMSQFLATLSLVALQEIQVLAS
jgi:hypothetical protein